MSLLAPTPPPETGEDGGGGGESPSLSPAPSPENDILPPPAPVFPTQPPVSPPQSSEPIAAPPLPVAVIGATPTPTSPILSSPPPTLAPSPPPPQAPLPSPPPIAKTNPPQKTPTPPSISPPIITKPAPSTKTNPATPASPPQPPPQQPPRPITWEPKTRPATKPSPIQQGPSRTKITKTPSAASTPPSSPLPTSAILPSPPPVALPVPQAPGGGAWLPFTPEAPAPLPLFPGPPAGVISSPAGPLFSNPINGIPSAFAPSDSSADGADHQNIEAANAAASSAISNGSNGFVVGLCVAGVLLLLLGIFFSILVFFCRRRQKKFAGDGSESKLGTSFRGVEEKTSLSQYRKEDSHASGQQVLVNVATPQGPNFVSSGATMANAGPTCRVDTPFCSGTFTYEELAGATDGFSDRNLLGQGGFGYVHKGVLPNGKEVAVKQLKMGGHQGEREFRAEVDTISQVHHKHLVSLVGYCIAGAERLLIYEFVPNNTLEFHLHGKGQPVMDWPTRLKIAIGSAKGLAYLHEDCSPTIIHRDIKAANILLDYNFEAKVSDFGLAKIFTNAGNAVAHMTTRVVGTFGYLAPEYASSGKVTDKSDVYSYGVMLLELITGRPPISNFESATNGSLVNWARPLLTQAIGDGNFESLTDPRLNKNYTANEMASMVACAAACVRLSAWRRPRMSQVVHALEGNLPLSELDDGTRPGHSGMHFPYESLDFDARNCIENLKRMAMTSNVNGHATNMYSENTSEYGLHPSVSTTDTT